MRIDRVRVDLVAVPLATPYHLSAVYGTLTHARALVLRLHTADGHVGLGEADPIAPFTDETPEGTLATMAERVAPALLGQRGDDVAGVRARLDAMLAGHATLKGAVDMALHDLAGKALGVPAHRLLGGARRERLPLLWPLGALPADRLRPVIEERLGQGFRTFMLKAGARPVEDEIRDARATVERYGDRAAFLVDANQGWSATDAVRFAAAARGLGLRLVEQPVARRDLEGLRRVREAADAPVSADESLQSLDDAVRLVEARAVDVFSIKVSKNGGLAPARRIAELGDAFGVRCLMNSMIELGISQAASLQLGAALGNLVDFGHAYMSTLRLADDVTDFGALVRDGEAWLPERPGLGVGLDEDRLEHYAVAHADVD